MVCFYFYQRENERVEYQMLLDKLSELKARKSRVDQLLSLLSELNISTGKKVVSRICCTSYSCSKGTPM